MRDFLFGLIGGAAILMYGVDLMGDGLERCAGNTMKSILSALTGNVYKAIAVSTILTALVQSSTAITVLTVGFVNAGLMTLTQAVGVIYGANIGTTVTAQLMAFKLTDYALLFVAIGFIVRLAGRSEQARYFGTAVMGFGLMFTGLKILNSGSPFLQQNEALRAAIITFGKNPLIAVLMGMFATMMVHSSSATVALTMVLAQAGLIDLTGAVGLMLGDNIGTCVTAQLASIGTQINARRTAWAHSLYNIIGVLIVLVFLRPFVAFTSSTATDISRQIANSHTIFNVLSAVVFLPFTKVYVKFLERVVPGGKTASHATFLDELLVPTPSAALEAVRAEIGQAAMLLTEMQDQSFSLIVHYDSKLDGRFAENEDALNAHQKNITMYLMKLTRQEITEDQSLQASSLLQAVNDLERIGDHFEEIVHLALRKFEENAAFTPAALRELEQMRLELLDIVENLPAEISDATLAPWDRIATVLKTADELRNNHVSRLGEGTCTVDAGVIFFDIINHVESITDLVKDISRSINPPAAA